MWPDAVDEILGGDQTVALAHVTPANGVVLTPVTNFALRDRASGSVAVNSSVGCGGSSQRIPAESTGRGCIPHPCAQPSRARPEYVLAQGRATTPLASSDPDAWDGGDG